MSSDNHHHQKNGGSPLRMFKTPSGKWIPYKNQSSHASSPPSSVSGGDEKSNPQMDENQVIHLVDFKRLLTEFCERNGLNLNGWKTVPTNPKDKRISYISKVDVNGESWITYPKTFNTPDEAELFVSKSAYSELCKRSESLKTSDALNQNPIAHASASAGNDVSVTRDDLIQKILEILKGEPSAITDGYLAEKYQKRYQTPLPKGWLDLISDSNHQLDVQKITIQNPERTITTIGKAAQKSSSSGSNRAPLNTLKKPSDANVPEDKNIIATGQNASSCDTTKENKRGSVDLELDLINGGLVIPPFEPTDPRDDEGFFEAQVTLVASPSKFWVQNASSLKEDSPYMKMLVALRLFYMNEDNHIGIPSVLVKKGMVVAAKHVDMWWRAKIHSVIPNDENPDQTKLMVCLIDSAEMAQVNITDIQPLMNDFRKVPIQAARCALRGFDVTTDEPKVDTATCLMFREMAEGKKHEAYVLRIEGKREDPLLTLDLISCDTADDITLAISRMIVTSDTA